MKKILVPIDFSDLTERVVECAVRFARALDADLYLVHVAPPEPAFVGYEPGPASVRQAVAQHVVAERRDLHAIEERLKKDGLKATALLVQGYTVDKILEEIDRRDVDLVIMGSHGHGALYHLIVGSVAEGVLRKSRRPVVLVPPLR